MHETHPTSQDRQEGLGSLFLSARRNHPSSLWVVIQAAGASVSLVVKWEKPGIKFIFKEPKHVQLAMVILTCKS